MDKETIIFLLIFFSIAIPVVSLLFPKGDRVKVIKVAIAFILIMVSLFLSVWAVGKVMPNAPEWIIIIVCLAIYSFLLSRFRRFVLPLADAPKQPGSEPDVGDNAIYAPGDER